MLLVGFRRGLMIVALAGVLGGCPFEATPQSRAEEVCTAYCQCFQPSDIDGCIETDCLPDIPSVSDPCLDCVHQNSQTCSDLYSDCTSLCLGPTP
jgi:hypothetical protein